MPALQKPVAGFGSQHLELKHLVVLAVHVRRSTTAAVAVLAKRRSRNTKEAVNISRARVLQKKMQLPLDLSSNFSVVLGIKMDYVLSVPSVAAAISAPKLVSQLLTPGKK